MKTIRKSVLVLGLIFFVLSCSKNEPQKPIIEEVEGNPMANPNPVNEETGADLLFNGTAILETKNARMPFIWYNKEGATSAAIDENLDGDMDKVVLTDGEAKTVIEMNVESGLPSKMYTSDNILVIYNFKENNTLLDLAVIKKDEETIYINDIDVSETEFTAKTKIDTDKSACPPIQKPLISMANGYRWAIGGWCKIKEDNNIVFQTFNIPARECRDIYRNMYPCCQISVVEDSYCKQLPNQTKVLSEIEQFVACAEDSDLDDCITTGVTDIQNILNDAVELNLLIGSEAILEAEAVLFNVVENNPGGNENIVGEWSLIKQEELFENVVDVVLIGQEYCDDPPNENSCYTIVEQTIEFKSDGTFTSILTELDKQGGTNGPSSEIIEKENGKWSYDADADELFLVALSYEYLENGVIVEQDAYPEGEIIFNESFTVSETQLIIIFDKEDNDADGIPEESYTEFYTKV